MQLRQRPLGDESSHAIIGAFYAVYDELGFGLLESAYAAALECELWSPGHVVEREMWVDVSMKDTPWLANESTGSSLVRSCSKSRPPAGIFTRRVVEAA